MAASMRAPKQWCLTRAETVGSFETWRQNLIFHLSQEATFGPFLEAGATWQKKTRAAPNRGLQNDAQPVPVDQRRTAQQKLASLELMLGQIANFCPIISRNTIVRNSTSLTNIWQQIRLHYGFQSTGGHFLDLAHFKLEHEEKPEDLYQRIMAFVEDNLLKAEGGISHFDVVPDQDKEPTPTVENMVVLIWLKLVHPGLPALVKERYGTELRSRTLASIKPEISQALPSLLDQLHTSEEVRAMASTSVSRRPRKQSTNTYPRRPARVCPLCKQAGRQQYDHFLSQCSYLPEIDKRFMSRARLVLDLEDDQPDTHLDQGDKTVEPDVNAVTNTPNISRVGVSRSPYFDTLYRHHDLRLTLDCGAETNLMLHSTARRIGAPVTPNNCQSASQADGKSALEVVGETRLTLTRGHHAFVLEALVVENLGTDVLAGNPFMEANDISVRPARRLITFSDGSFQKYNSNKNSGSSVVRRVHTSVILRAPASQTTLWPGESIEIALPEGLPTCNSVAIEPRTDTKRPLMCTENMWPIPFVTDVKDNTISIDNPHSTPIILTRKQCIGQALLVAETLTPNLSDSVKHIAQVESSTTHSGHYSANVKVNPDGVLNTTEEQEFRAQLQCYDHVFDPSIPGYNGNAGPFQAVVNMGPTKPPQRKGRVPQYARNKLQELQARFDELEALGVFRKPEDVSVSVEYLSPSFLVKKPNGGFRLVTAFTEIAKYAKPQPSLMPDVNATLRAIGQWKYLIVTDLTNAFYQIPLSADSYKYCGVATPFKGIRVYTRSAMGMPGSETALEELTCRVLGSLLEKGTVAKVADDLYCGGSTPGELLQNWKEVLTALDKCNLRLSATKTIVCPGRTRILGWIWSEGTLSANPHFTATLSTCDIPPTIGSLRSFVGAYKVLARVMPGCSRYLSPLEDLTAGRTSSEPVPWSESDIANFRVAQAALKNCRAITLPRSGDILWLSTDAACRHGGLGATMYASRNGSINLAGFFSAKLRRHQLHWLPCELEALAIASAIKHFSAYLVQSRHQTTVLTDSRPCVQAFQKMSRGEFSASPRVTTFLTTASRYNVQILHLAGADNIPSDFASRNAPQCRDASCQVCSFVNEQIDSTVCGTSASDIIEGHCKLPFTSRSAWAASQSECPDLRRTRAHLYQGTRPGRKETCIKDVRRYLQVCRLAKDGLVVVTRHSPLENTKDLIVVPRRALPRLLMSLHLSLGHPSTHQLKQAVKRYFYALDMDSAMTRVGEQCHQCTSLKSVPQFATEQSSVDPPEVMGVAFAADIMRRHRQLIMVVREIVTSYTTTAIVADETKSSLRAALISCCMELRPLDGPVGVIRTDPAPGFSALEDDSYLHECRLGVEIGRHKNPNKNPVAERAVQELQQELLRLDPMVGPVSASFLAIATARLNSRIRARGLSSREILFHRDQFTGAQIPVCDQDIILQNHRDRNANHPHSEKSKAQGKPRRESPYIQLGDLVYVITDCNKLRGRDRYLVVGIDGAWCTIRKFVGAQLRALSYRVRRSDCLLVPYDDTLPSQCHEADFTDDDDVFAPQEAAKSPGPEYKVSQTPHPHHLEIGQYPVSEPQRQPVTPMDLPDSGPVDADAGNLADNRGLRRSSRTRHPPRYLKDYVI